MARGTFQEKGTAGGRTLWSSCGSMVTNVLFHPVYYGRYYAIRTIWTICYLRSYFILMSCVPSYPARLLATPATHTLLIIFSDRVVRTDKYNLLQPFLPIYRPSIPITIVTTSPRMSSSSSSKPGVSNWMCTIRCVMTIRKNTTLAFFCIYFLF